MYLYVPMCMSVRACVRACGSQCSNSCECLLLNIKPRSIYVVVFLRGMYSPARRCTNLCKSLLLLLTGELCASTDSISVFPQRVLCTCVSVNVGVRLSVCMYMCVCNCMSMYVYVCLCVCITKLASSNARFSALLPMLMLHERPNGKGMQRHHLKCETRYCTFIFFPVIHVIIMHIV